MAAYGDSNFSKCYFSSSMHLEKRIMQTKRERNSKDEKIRNSCFLIFLVKLNILELNHLLINYHNLIIYHSNTHTHAHIYTQEVPFFHFSKVKDTLYKITRELIVQAACIKKCNLKIIRCWMPRVLELILSFADLKVIM